MSTPGLAKSSTRKVTRKRMSGDELREELSAIQATVVQREQDDLRLPIAGEQDFLCRLEQMDRAYKQARFDENLRIATKHLHGYLKRSRESGTLAYWKARTLVYELNDVFNIAQEINEAAFNDGHKVLEELRFQSVRWEKATQLEITNRKLLREKVLFCACRGNELRRRGEVSLALNLFEWLLAFTNTKIKTDALPCYATRAGLSYHVGSTLRALEQHRQAESMYSQALNLLYDRGKRLDVQHPDDNTYLIRKQAMVVGLGYGWINLTRGFLARAENALTTARSMLVTVNDPHLSAYVSLLHGTIRRCRAGTNQNKLNDAITELQLTRRSFMNHPRHQARTCWELALAKTLTGDLNGAQNDLRFVSTYAEQTMNRKWQVNVQILQSRIHRKQGKFAEAKALADTAVEMAESPDCKTVLPLLDALITRGEAHLSLARGSGVPQKQYSKALADFDGALKTMALKIGSGKSDYFANPKIASVCVLRIAQCYARMENQAAAKKNFEIWLRLEPHIEHEWIQELASRIKTEIDKLSMDFTISASEPNEWSYADAISKLQRWLLAQALRKTNRNYSEAARLIGVQRATLYQWQNQSPSVNGSHLRKTKNAS